MAPTALIDLPVALTAQILSRVPLAERLPQCALVCCTWACAAALATEHVKIKLRADTIPAFESWLQLHAGQLLSVQLQVAGYRSFVLGAPALHHLQLPLRSFSQLQRLELDRLTLRLPGGTDSSSQRDRQAWQWPHLQDMQLCLVDLEDISSLLQLTAAPQLTRLDMAGLDIADVQFHGSTTENTEAAVQQVAAALPRMLAQLPRLSVLELPGMPVTDAALQEMARLQGLQQVTLEHMRHVPVCDLQLLPSSITQLDLHDKRPVKTGASLPAQLPQLTALLHLSLRECNVDPTVLESFTQLQTLVLATCTLLPLPEHPVAVGIDEEDPQPDTAGTTALLDALSKLTCLQELELQDLDAIHISPQRCSALTASSQLTALHVSGYDTQPLPKAAVRHMFPAGRPAPQLRELMISQDSCDYCDDWCLHTADLAAICKGCPSLQYLQLVGVVAESADPRPLLQLPQSCTRLWVGGWFFDDSVAAIIVAHLTQLKDLTWTTCHGFTDAGLEEVAALDLDELCVENCGLGADFDYFDPNTLELRLSRDPQKGSVAEQLRALREHAAAESTESD